MMEVRNKNWFPFLILSIFCFVTFFAFIGSYPLIDVDETRYVRIAQEMFISNNFLTPMINGEIFLEKPPLFFWLENISFYIFGVSEISARLPMALVATFGVFMTYYFGQKLVSKRFALISSLVLGSNIIYIVLSHIAILDLILSVSMMVSAYFGILTLYSKGRENWLQWICFYLFCGLSALAKGLPGIVVPFGIVFFVYLFSKKIKLLFDFKKIILGVILLLIIFLPWHILMYKTHGQAFIDEYIFKHHLARFVNSAGLNRKEPFWFFIPVILVGFIPFVLPLFSAFCNEIKKFILNFRNGFNFNIYKYFEIQSFSKKSFLAINILAFIFVFGLFSSASTKLPTYILPAIFPLSYIVGYIFDEYYENNKFELQIKISNIVLSTIFLLASIAAFLIILFPKLISIELSLTKIAWYGFILFGAYSIYNIVNLIKKRSQMLFFNSSIVFMSLLTIILNLVIFNFVVDFGQRDLINFATYAKTTNKKLATFDFGHRYSVIYYYGDKVDIQEEADYSWFNDKLEKDYVVVLKNKNMLSMPSEVKYQVISAGKKYSLVKKYEQE